MKALPARPGFVETYGAGRPQVVWTTLVSDLETPVSAMIKLADGQKNCFLLESVTGGEVRGRYSFIGLRPDLIWRCRRDRVEINRRARFDTAAFEPTDEPPLQALRSLLAESRIDLPAELPPMAAGLFGYLGYDMVRLIERLPDDNPDMLGIPDAILMRPTIIAVFDGIQNQITLVTPVWPAAGLDADAAYDLALERLGDAISDLQRNLPYRREATAVTRALPEPVSNTTREEYHAIVERAKEYIRAGDVFQVVPSHRFSVPFELPPFSLYRALRRLNPSPFLLYLDFEDLSIVGSSPEILVRLRDGKVTIRPIAGTRKRGATPEEDKILAADLLSDPKELSEHLMLLDLGRNDVGRVAEIGSVTVTERMVIEYYSHVMHIVSNVEGTIDPKHDALDALFAGFPAGTVSGAPKVRAMEIIDELEKARRGVYGGCVGYFGANGAMDTCIALRTAVLKDGIMHVQAGGGVVADSDPEAEYQETVNKSRALIRAAEEAVRFASSR
ncbi:anthranilate synthase component I [Skermanella mucosa]|uniref:anthranilate synthase component I n=1 Tax=Skermanella mucosa TaxID=1789672 RepID=UPI00192B5ECB|nr:anthranilate synthase component I [Skermanella mucosa]UEM23475.1 anthranilate synthase component I [Skermanella mucosa]